MKRLGSVLHKSSQGKLIVRADFAPTLSALVVSSNLDRVGTVFDVFGPISKPYVSVKPFKGTKSEQFVGKYLYLLNKKDKKRVNIKEKGRKKKGKKVKKQN